MCIAKINLSRYVRTQTCTVTSLHCLGDADTRFALLHSPTTRKVFRAASYFRTGDMSCYAETAKNAIVPPCV